MARKKSSFYHIRWNRVGLNEQRTAEILGVSVEDVLPQIHKPGRRLGALLSFSCTLWMYGMAIG